MNTIYELNEEHARDLHHLYQEEWWSKGRSLSDTKCCIRGSQINVGLVDEGNSLVAYARVLTDFTFKAFIFDVIVSKAHRGKGLGNQLVSLVKNHKELQSIKHFELYCHPEMIPFYQKHGFSTQLDDIQLMRLS